MKSILSFLFLCVGVAVAQNASSEEAAALQLLLSMPSCGLQCLEAAVAASPCDSTDLTCSCSNATITGQVALCVAQSCAIKDALATKNVSEIICQAPVRDQTNLVIWAAMVGCGIAIVAFILRMISRAVGEGSFMINAGWDDVVMAAALVIVVGISGCSVLLAEHGLGKDIWTVPFDHITYVLHVYYFDEILYIVALPLIKISLILTYLRIFPQPSFRLVAYIVIGINICYMIAFEVVTVIQCSPISYSWTKWDGEHQGTCMHVNAQVYCAAAFNILLDVLIVIMPMPILWRMNMNLRKKILIMLMFAVGFFVTVVSALRLRYLVKFSDSSNATWDYVRIGYWSTIEMHASVLCACMPGMRRLFKYLWPRVMGATTKSPGGSDNSNGFSGPPVVATTDADDMKYRPAVKVRRKSSGTSNLIPLGSIDSRQETNYSHPIYSNASGDDHGRVSPV